jgi:hypothetical protein
MWIDGPGPAACAAKKAAGSWSSRPDAARSQVILAALRYQTADLGRRMRRREFIAGLGGAAAWPLAARGQQPGLPVVGFVEPGLADASLDDGAAFRKGLRETGYVEGQNATIEYRWAEGQYDRLPALMDDLVHRRVAVIATIGRIDRLPKSCAKRKNTSKGAWRLYYATHETAKASDKSHTGIGSGWTVFVRDRGRIHSIRWSHSRYTVAGRRTGSRDHPL